MSRYSTWQKYPPYIRDDLVVGEGRVEFPKDEPETAEPKKPEPTFNRACRATLGESLKTQAQRGMEYGDSWALENMNPVYLKAILKEFDVYLDDAQLRLVMLAALVDVKTSRIQNGEIKKDSVVDKINYLGVLIHLLEEYRGADR